MMLFSSVRPLTFIIIVFSNSLPMARVSFLYIVVWFAMPTFLRCFSGSNPLLTCGGNDVD